MLRAVERYSAVEKGKCERMPARLCNSDGCMQADRGLNLLDRVVKHLLNLIVAVGDKLQLPKCEPVQLAARLSDTALSRAALSARKRVINPSLCFQRASDMKIPHAGVEWPVRTSSLVLAAARCAGRGDASDACVQKMREAVKLKRMRASSVKLGVPQPASLDGEIS